MKIVLLKLLGSFVDIIGYTNLEHEANVRNEMGQRVQYLRVLRVIYGYIKWVLQWYTLYTETIQKNAYVINTYNPCVTDKVIWVKQCSIFWYNNYRRVLYENPNVIDGLISD